MFPSSMLHRLTFALGVTLLFASCQPERYNDPDHKVTIVQGIYGMATKHDDVGANPVVAWKDARFIVYANCPAGSGYDPDNPVIAEVTSDYSGFYQLPLDPGDYVVCTAFQRCTTVTVAPNSRVRLDYEFSVGPGWSNSTVPAPCQ